MKQRKKRLLFITAAKHLNYSIYTLTKLTHLHVVPAQTEFL